MSEKYQIIFSIVMAIVISIPIILLIQKKLKQQEEKRKKAFNDLIKELHEGISNTSITNFIDFRDFIIGSEQIENLNLKFPHSFEKLLLRTKNKLIQAQDFEKNTQKTVEEIKVDIKKSISEVELKDPFKNVPTSERNLLIDIMELSNLKTDTVFISKLHNLGNIIRTKEEQYIKSGKDNEESLRLAKQSKILAIVFGIISLSLTIYSIWK